MTASSRSRLAVNFAIAGLTTLLMLPVFELFARAFIPVRDVGSVFTVYDPIYGKRLKANFHGTQTSPEFRFEMSTNSLGMRDPEPTKPVTGGIVFLGGSFTMGYGVQDSETFTAIIRSALESRGITTPVLNAGVGDTGIGRWVKFFDHDAPKFRPRIVIFEAMAIDLDNRNIAEHLFQLDANGALRELPVGPPSFGRRVQTLIDSVPGLSRSYLVSLALMARTRIKADQPYLLPGAGPDELRASDELTFALFRAAADKALAAGADVVCLLIRNNGERRAKIIEKIFQERGVSCLEGPNKHDAPDMYYKLDGHWNAAGQRRVAEVLLPEILRLIDQPQHSPGRSPPPPILGHL